ncbi:MAG: hypothetical protein HYS20_01240 [Rhodocyclales bacterium]|nr:hypothetical protein [Rhodocyclales bacterium]
MDMQHIEALRPHLPAGRTLYSYYKDRYGLQLLRYAPHRALWDEAMLSAALFFIREQLGIARVWMHTPESGLLLKRIRHGAPPRSIYSTLPRRFCFEPTRELPAFLRRNKSISRQMRRQPDLALHALTLQE